MKIQKKPLITMGETVLVVAGALLLLSVYAISTASDFRLFISAKVLYGVGVLWLLFRS